MPDLPAQAKVIRDKFKRAQEAIPDQPLTYKVVCQKSDEKDEPGCNRFGGVPDWSMTLGAVKSGKYDFKRWPRCAVCHDPMSFVAQVKYKEWPCALHMMTGTPGKYQNTVSAMGSSTRHDLPMGNSYWLIFACLEGHYNTPAHNAALMVGDYYSTPKQFKDLGITERDEKLGGQKEAKAFAKKNGIRLLPSFRFTQELRFEVDLGTSWDAEYSAKDYKRFDRLEAAREEAYKAHPDLFDEHGDVCLFGQPASQQEPYRPWGANGFYPPYRMTPLINWSDNEHDMTHQVYMDMLWGDKFAYSGLLDSSCT